MRILTEFASTHSKQSPKGAISRRKSKRRQSCTRITGEERLDGSYVEGIESNLSTDENLEFSHLVASVKLTTNRPPLPDIIERPKSSLPTTKAFPLAVSLTRS